MMTSEAARDQGWYPQSTELREEVAERELRRLRAELAEDGIDDGHGLDALAEIRSTIESKRRERLVIEAEQRKTEQRNG